MRETKPMTDPLRDEIEKAFRTIKRRDDKTLLDQALSIALEFVKRERAVSEMMTSAAQKWMKRAEAAERERNELRINQDESDECTAELFSLVCAVLDGKPEAAKARTELAAHVEHVRSCRKGSCDTELHGGPLRRRVEELEKALAERGHVARCKCSQEYNNQRR